MGSLAGMVLVLITPSSVEENSWGTQAGQRGEKGELAELCVQTLAVISRRDQSPATTHVPRLSVSLICWEGKFFPCNFSP